MYMQKENWETQFLGNEELILSRLQTLRGKISSSFTAVISFPRLFLVNCR